MDEFPSNSNRAKASQPGEAEPPKKKVEPIVTGKVIKRKTPIRTRLTNIFMGGNPKQAAAHVFTEVLVPGAKNVFADAMYQGVDKIVFGEVRSTSVRGVNPLMSGIFGGGGPMGSPFTTNYQQISTPTGQTANQAVKAISGRAGPRPNFGQIIIPSRHEADEVINKMAWFIQEYQFVSVSDLCEMLNLQAEFTDEKYGWTDIRQLGIKRVTQGYLLVLPNPQPLA